MKKVLFIDRDGTIITEPPVTFQIDTLEKLSFLPGVIRYLSKIAEETDYELVMVSNQDGLGTEQYPLKAFELVQGKILEILKNEGIEFSAIHIDDSFEHEHKPTRKPGTAMLKKYLNGNYDLKNSYVIGDRITDVLLAQNLGCKAILIKNYDNPQGYESKIALIANNWREIYDHLKLPDRKISHTRKTNETTIEVHLNLDGKGLHQIDTGLSFFNHMLEQLAKHAHIDLVINAQGDLHIDEHHTIEDTAITLGEAFNLALGDKIGIERYGFLLPMDDCLAQVALDFGGRSWLVWQTEFKREKIGDVPTEMFYHFFKSFADAAKCNLHIKADGENEHHKIESIFKAWAKTIKSAVKRDINNLTLPTTKGTLS
jgi:imidazoleglycerol-phosphate dehydratase/histidinol-phosphatase